MSASVRRWRRCYESWRQAAELPRQAGARTGRRASFFGRLLSELFQKFSELALGRLLQRIECLLLACGGGEIARIAVGEHEAVVSRFVAGLQFDGVLQQFNGGRELFRFD